MHSTPLRRGILAVSGITALALPLAACSVGGGSGGGSASELTILMASSGEGIEAMEAAGAAFTEEHPDVTVTVTSRPGGGEGDNIIKTKLNTGEMESIFGYNSGSQLQGLKPDNFLVDLSDEAWVADLEDDMKTVVSGDDGLYGTPLGASFGGAVMYNKAIYAELGLEVPEDWDTFVANNDAISEAGYDAVIQSYGDPWTSQLWVLGDFANVLAQDPDWADEYTANNRRYADQPALQGLLNQQEAGEAGWFNEDFASTLYDEALAKLANGEGAHYPILTNAISAIEQNSPDAVDDIGVFALPAQDAADTRLSVWLPNALYIPDTTEGEELDLAKEFLAFMNSDAGCEIQNEYLTPGGPYATSACTLPSDVPPMIGDMQAYFDEGMTAPALEFLSPIKGPKLEQLTVEVGSGIRSAEDAAALYDDDVVKQAQQLGIEGW
ncbi:ABC transporter substrate-binding protein [Microbacterium excoecariae]|uniref:ABC transporter substrate-binding protein n=1 Tax=Microbacterium excoecariae TaxID=2715210 RepID=UPI00140AC6BF|nr:ABC transporter substrate-binding protein [Microbacterium excoecariae]NHI15738.1 carbohydrate ABC transporter substrate-binding protein [Microbacterium excoecariae]